MAILSERIRSRDQRHYMARCRSIRLRQSMGASRGLAMSLAPVVLILIMVPAALASPVEEELPVAVDPEQAIEDAQERASASQSEAEKAADRARIDAEDQVLAVYEVATGSVAIVWD